MKKHVKIEYYALLREERGRAAEDHETSATTLGELYAELRAAHGFSLDRERLQVARNEEFADWRTSLEDGDVVVFIPPVAGG